MRSAMRRVTPYCKGSADRLLQGVWECDTVARVGGDEFLTLLDKVADGRCGPGAGCPVPAV